jgi:HlyD family secretion protein
MRVAVIVIVMLSVAAFAAYKYLPGFSATPSPSPTPEVKTAEVKKGDLAVVVEATGRVVPEQEVEIKCKASGEVVEVLADISDKVAKGDLLVRLDPEDEQRTVQKMEASLAVTKAKLAQSKLALEAAEKDLDSQRTKAQADLVSMRAKAKESEAKRDRTAQLVERKMASPEELETAQTTLDQAIAAVDVSAAKLKDIETSEINLRSLRESIKISEAQVKADEITLSDAKKRLEETSIVAPISGVVAQKNVAVGQIIASGTNNVSGGTLVMTIADLSKMYVLVSVDESDIGKVRIGNKAAIRVDAFPDRAFDGEVVRIATKGAVTSNVVTFEVKVEVKGRGFELLKPEMTANVEIVTTDKKGVLLIPVGAVELKKRERFVVLVTPSGSEERQIAVGETDGVLLEVTSGLKEGDKIVLQSSQGKWKNGTNSGSRPPGPFGF